MKKNLLCIFLFAFCIAFLFGQKEQSSRINYPQSRIQPSDIFSIHPNPSTTDIRVQLPKNTTKIRIISLTGKVVYEESIKENLGYQVIDVSPFRRGTYFLRIEGPNNIHTKKLIRG